MDLAGTMLWAHYLGASVWGGCSIADGTLFVGGGSGIDDAGKRGHTLYAFTVNGRPPRSTPARPPGTWRPSPESRR